MVPDWLTPALIIAAFGLLWREIKDLGKRMDRHLEGHPK